MPDPDPYDETIDGPAAPVTPHREQPDVPVVLPPLGGSGPSRARAWLPAVIAFVIAAATAALLVLAFR